MPVLEHDKAIKEFFLEVKDKYPDISFEQFSFICRSPFQAIKMWIKDPTLPQILVKYLGKIKIFPSKIKMLQRVNDAWFKKGEIEEIDHINRKRFLDRYLAELEKEDQDLEIIEDEN